ncbi:caspase family protein [Candidatus Electronema sp. PJ]|uniref:caspase family protein n=1 Tax=Candidatus Electronema sp. PJ TaxID=3401572 RepID=UPI003AA87397
MPDKLMPNNKHHAIVIGINNYPLIGLDPLKGPVNDANDFCAWLRDPAGGNLPPENIQRVLSSDFNPKDALPTPNQVETLFEKFIGDYYDGKKEGERLYIFTSGHGFGDPRDIGKTALYAANAKRMFPWHIAVTDYAEWLRSHAVFDEIVLIMDCCRTVNLPYEIREPQYVVGQGSIGADSVRYFYAFAARRGSAAKERKFEDGRISGIFTKALLDALKVASPDAQGQVTGQQLKNHLHNSIGRFAGNVTIKPPDIMLDSTQDIVFCKRKAAATIPVKVSLTAYTGAETLVLYDGSFREIRQVQATTSPLTLALEPGLYKIAVKNTGRQKIIEVPNNEQITV